jgi:hypothetical protein
MAEMSIMLVPSVIIIELFVADVMVSSPVIIIPKEWQMIHLEKFLRASYHLLCPGMNVSEPQY